MNRIKIGALAIAFLVSLPLTSSASWLSSLLDEGKLPPIDAVGLCVIAPNLCLANETIKEEARRRSIEEENKILQKRLVQYRQDTNILIQNIKIRNEDERSEIQGALNEADNCLLQATDLTGADNCVLNMRKKVFEINRKYQSM
ncbi:hypothetical protein [Desulfovibrio sp. DV]|uniref:hypothetical protein n=1 Tax=Desulfovibrio sp. DV TaxID=1844708 RepID=UPI00111506B9|nr:hypothetical protein [Desulfovibrio sp. DV]